MFLPLRRNSAALRIALLWVLMCAAAAGAAITAGPAATRGGHPFDTPLPSVRLTGTLVEALAHVQESGGVQVRVDWAALAAAGVRPATTAGLAVKDASPAQVLSLLLVQATRPGSPLAWVRQEDIVLVSTQLRILHNRREVSQFAKPVEQPSGEPVGPAQPPPASRPPFGPWGPLPVPAPYARPGAYTNRIASQPASPPVRPPAGPAQRPVPAGGAGARRSDYSFNEMPLSEVLEFFRTTTGANLFVNWKSLEALGIAPATPVSLELSNVTARRALDLVLEQLTATDDPYQRIWWVADQGVVAIASGAVLDAQMRVAVVDVTDLVNVMPYTDFESFGEPTLGAAQGGSSTSGSLSSSTTAGRSSTSYTSGGGSGRSSSVGSGGSSDTSGRTSGTTTGLSGPSRERLEANRQNLADIIRGSIDARMWEPRGKGSIRFQRNKLVISQSLLGFKMLQETGRL